MSEIKLAWVDLETTGLEANLDVPLELGIALTDEWGQHIASAEWLIWEESEAYRVGVARGMNNDFVREMHENSGLWDDLANPRLGTMTREEVDRDVCSFLQENGVKFRTLPMTGNSIGSLDRPFALVHFPLLNEALSYRNVDISTFKEVCRHVNPELFENLRDVADMKGDASHRVMDDIKASIREYAAYLDNFLIVGD